MRHVKNNDNSDQDDDGNGTIMIAMIPEGEANKCRQMCFNDIYYLYKTKWLSSALHSLYPSSLNVPFEGKGPLSHVFKLILVFMLEKKTMLWIKFLSLLIKVSHTYV